jgi:integrase
LLDIRTENVNLEQCIIKGGTKTKAGKNRLVPIHSKIFELVKARMKRGGEYLLTHDGKKLSKQQYYKFWRNVMEQIKAKHTVHECRHTLRSRLDSAGANKVCIDLIMGHKSTDVGERIYTHKTIQELRKTIELVTR